MKSSVLTMAGLAVATVLIAAPAAAQKSKETFRAAFILPTGGTSYYLDPSRETAMLQGAVYDGLVWFDNQKKEIVPLLAKSWARSSDGLTLTFDLRDDVTWHDGEKFDADDVVYTYRWLTAPETKIRFKQFWSWISRVEKLGPHKVSITAREPAPFDLARHASLTAILPEHIHSKFEDKVQFELKPVGTGMFRLTQLNKNDGIKMELNDKFLHGGSAKPVTNVKRMHFAFIPEMGTQIAHFMARDLDAVLHAPLDAVLELRERDGIKLSFGSSISYQYVAFDAKGRSGHKPVQDIRVRQAILHAIDRDALSKLASGPFDMERPEAMCWKLQAGCDYSLKQPAYDPAKAKKLLAEAGYSEGFEVTLTTFTSPAVLPTAQAISGMLSKVGIKASLDRNQIQTYLKKQRDGEIQMFVGPWPAGGMPDVSGTLEYLYNSPDSTDYHGDATLKKLASEMNTVFDPVERRRLGRKIFDRATEQAYFMALIANPTAVVHTPDVSVKIGSLSAFTIEAWDFRWN